MKIRLENSILLLSLVAAFTGPAWGRDEIRVRPAALIGSARVCLKDVAEIKAEGPVREKLENILVADLREKRVSQVSSFEISRALAQAQIVPASIMIYGATACRLDLAAELRRQFETQNELPGKNQKSNSKNQNEKEEADPASKVISSRTVADELREMIGRNAGVDPNQVIVDWQGSKELLQKAAGRFGIKPLGHVGLGQVAFELRDPNQPGKRSLRLGGEAFYQCTVVAARQPVGAGEMVAAQDVELVPQRVTALTEMGVTDPEAVVGQVARRPIAARQVIEATMLRKLTLVKQKEPVDIVLQTSRLEINLQGVALADGGLGDTVKVKNAKDETILSGVVVGAGKIRVGEKALEPLDNKIAKNDKINLNRKLN